MWKFKTEKEFKQEFGVGWRGYVLWAPLGYNMDELLGKPLSYSQAFVILLYDSVSDSKFDIDYNNNTHTLKVFKFICNKFKCENNYGEQKTWYFSKKMITNK